MRLLFLDDSRQKNCTRDKIDALVAIGGIIVDVQVAKDLEQAVDQICKNFGFPDGEPFKWSPKRDYWMWDKLVGDRREAFFSAVLSEVDNTGGIGLVAICDPTKATATKNAQTHEMDALVLVLERFDWVLQEENELGMVIVSRPSGGRGDEDSFLLECDGILTAGTDYRKFNRIVTNVLTMPFRDSRFLQVADLVVSITNAAVAGSPHAEAVFPSVRMLLRSSDGRIGGVGVKIHPDSIYVNLYHWVLRDDIFLIRRAGTGFALPIRGRPFFVSPTRYYD